MILQIFSTGGTIDKVYFDARSEYAVGDPQITEILKTAGVTLEWKIDTLLQKDSLDMTGEDRRVIADAIAGSPARHIVVTHGTDTMVETARVVEEQLGAELRTVVFVGSLSPALLKNSDAEFNIGFAVGVVQTLEPGVYIAMNGRVFPAGDVRKNLEENRFEGTPLTS
jgi:L-asparaginase